METQLQQTDVEQLHPEIAFQVGIQQEKVSYDIHPSLQAEVEASAETKEDVTVDKVETVEEPVVDKTETTATVAEDPKERDWRAARAKADEARQLAREKEHLERELAFYREQVRNPQPVVAQSDDFRTDTEKELQNQMEQLRQQVARQEKETQQAKQQMAVSRAEQRLAQDYPDIREVVSDDNIKRLEFEYPHLYNSVISSNDVYTVGSAAYEMIMAKGIYKKPVSQTLSSIASNASRNLSKPKSASSVSPQAGETPIKQANSFMGNSISSEEERKALYDEMRSYARYKI